MDLVFGGDFDYERGGLVLVSLGMGLYLAAATLNQALLAHGARAAGGARAGSRARPRFVLFLLLADFDDRVLQVEVGLPRRGARACARCSTRCTGAPEILRRVAETLTIPARFNGPPGVGQRRLHLRAAGAGCVGAEVVAGVAARAAAARAAARRWCATATAWSCATATRSWPRASPPSCCSTCPSRSPPTRRPRPRRPGCEHWAAAHPFPTCVVCGPGARAAATACASSPARCRDGDCSPPTGRPDESLGDGDGHVRPECVWAALDCPTSAPVANFGEGPPMVLARLTARLGVPGARRRAARARVVAARGGRPQAPRRLRAVRLRGPPAVRLARALDRAARSRLRAMALHYRTCPFCEATCGLEVETDGRRGRVGPRRRDDVFSHGFICPKALRAQAAARGPRPADARRSCAATASCVEASWDEAFAEIDRRLSPHPRRARPQRGGRLPRQPERAQPLGAALRAGAGCARSARRTSTRASTVDQMPKQVSAGLMFGTMLSRPGARRRPHRPPADARRQPAGVERQPAHRARHARPPARASASAAARSWWSTRAARAPPRRPTSTTSSARAPTRCCSPRWPARSSRRGSRDPGRSPSTCNGLDEVRELVRELHARGGGAAPAGSPAGEIRRMARELAARRARRRVRAHRHLHAGVRHARQLAGRRAQRAHRQPRPRGRRDVPAGRRRPAQLVRRAAAAAAACASGAGTSRVRGLPEAFGELPVACLAEEIETPGEGQVRALITVAGNPVVSTPNSGPARARGRGPRLHARVDIYVNETTRHADVILPAPEPLEKSHYDLALYQLAARNVANYSPPVFERAGPAEWEMLLRLAGRGGGPGPERRRRGARRPRDRRRSCGARSADPARRVAGRDPAELLEALEPRRGPERLLDFMLRAGPYGDGFGDEPDGLTLDVLERNPHGVDLGPLGRGSPRCCARRRARSSWRPSRSWPTSSACAAALARAAERRHGADRPPPAALEQLVDAQPARAREGQGPLHAARPPRRRRAARPRRTAAARCVQLGAPASSRRRSR